MNTNVPTIDEILQERLDENVTYSDYQDERDWGHQIGVLISATEAKAAVESLRLYKELVEAVEDVTDLLSIVPKEYLEKVERLGDILDKIKQSAQ